MYYNTVTKCCNLVHLPKMKAVVFHTAIWGGERFLPVNMHDSEGLIST